MHLPAQLKNDVDRAAPWMAHDAIAAYPEPGACPVDRPVLTEVLGPPDAHGRWVATSGTTPAAAGPGAARPRPAPAAAAPESAGAAGLQALVAAAGVQDQPAEAPAGSTTTAGPRPDREQLTEVQRGVYAALEDGHHQFADIRQHAGWKPATVHKALAELQELGLVDNPRKGKWVLPRS
jgi:hypothetical protein